MTILLALAGCAASRPYAAADSRALDDQNPQPKALLNDADRAEIRAAFVSLIAEHEPVMKPAPAAEGAA